jgi:hypothetical protein
MPSKVRILFTMLAIVAGCELIALGSIYASQATGRKAVGCDVRDLAVAKSSSSSKLSLNFATYSAGCEWGAPPRFPEWQCIKNLLARNPPSLTIPICSALTENCPTRAIDQVSGKH